MTGSAKLREPGSAITHMIGLAAAALAFFPIQSRALATKNLNAVTAVAVFMTSMILLYAASTLYHSVRFEGAKLRIFKRIDHMMIFVLIAGTYTPICLLVLSPVSGRRLLIFIWAFAAAGMLVKLFWIGCPKWFSSLLYTAMGWVCVLSFGELWTALGRPAFAWLLAGGLFYTVGAVIYALNPPAFNRIHKKFGTHEIFHLFVMAGSICHFICIYCFVL